MERRTFQKGSQVEVMRPVKKLLQVNSKLGEEPWGRERGKIPIRKHNYQDVVMK